MPDDKVTSLGAHRALKEVDNRLWSVADCLQDALNDVKSMPCDKVVVIRITTTNDKGEDVFNVGYHAAQIKASEILAALEIMKYQIIEEMGY